MKRNKGIITILAGVGLLFISFLFSSGSHPRRDFIGNISHMELVLVKGDVMSGYGKVAIPLKYPLSLSFVLILLGTGIVLIAKNEETHA